MPKCACSRCGQHIEFDAAYEGEEVICPGCDNITMLTAAASVAPPAVPTAIPVATQPPQPSSPAPASPAVPSPVPKPKVAPAPASPAPAAAKPVTPAEAVKPGASDGALPAKIKPGAAKKKTPTPPPPPPKA